LQQDGGNRESSWLTGDRTRSRPLITTASPLNLWSTFFCIHTCMASHLINPTIRSDLIRFTTRHWNPMPHTRCWLQLNQFSQMGSSESTVSFKWQSSSLTRHHVKITSSSKLIKNQYLRGTARISRLTRAISTRLRY
jgi:hypothetical protein